MDPYLFINREENSNKNIVLDIPFMMSYENKPFEYRGYDVDSNDNVYEAYLSGMVTISGRCSEWWGPNESNHTQAERMFFGDCLGYVNFVYEDNLMDVIPLIFGVNVFTYELLNQRKPYENNLEMFNGPYNEPFASDLNAKELLDKSLQLYETEEGKTAKYIMCVKLKGKPLKEIIFSKHPSKNTGVFISAITLLKDKSLEMKWNKKVNAEMFLNGSYKNALSLLSHRLYQYKSDISNNIQLIDIHNIPSDVLFTGSNMATILTNVYRLNLQDMAHNKVSDDGFSHTSTKNSPEFGCYVGMGTYTRVGPYYTHMWSRDVGRVLIELAFSGNTEKLEKSADVLCSYLDERASKYGKPNWKRIANLSDLDPGLANSLGGKENDGHAAIMIFLYICFVRKSIHRDWFCKNKEKIEMAADWFIWQMSTPAESHFDKVLYSESEASTQYYGGYDLFSNVLAMNALRSFAQLARELQWRENGEKYLKYADILSKGIDETFTYNDNRYGKAFYDNIYDCWTYRYKRFVPAMIYADVSGYDLSKDEALYSVMKNTYSAQKDEYFNPYSGRQMGYGQGYLTQTALLLDEYDDYSKCLEACAFLSYHHSDCSYIVPEGVIMHPSGEYWFRNGDLGNAVQQGEIIKAVRIMIGLDDINDDGLKLLTRLPSGIRDLKIKKFTVRNRNKAIHVDYNYKITNAEHCILLKSNEPIYIESARMGPFPTSNILIDTSYIYEIINIGEYYYVNVEVQKEQNELMLIASCVHNIDCNV